MIAVIVAPDGDCSIAMTRACFEPASAVLLLGSPALCAAGFGVGTGVADDATVSFSVDFDFAALDIEILRSVSGNVVLPPPKPHLGQQAGGA
jgi:hypothetical protein